MVNTPLLDKTRRKIETPRAAAIAGILFALLYGSSLVLIRISIPTDLTVESSAWLDANLKTISLALNMIPYAGIAFLWFIGVVRDRLGEYEDRLFSTVFIGSGLLFLAMLFTSAATAGGVITAFQTMPQQIIDTSLYGYGRATTYELMNTYAIKMAGVFMLSSCTLFLRLKLAPRWMVYLGYALALGMILITGLSNGAYIWLRARAERWMR